MQIGFIGLGRMGENIVYHLLERGHHVVAFNRSPEPVERVAAKGARGVHSIPDLIKTLKGRKIVWMMVTAGKPVDEIIATLLPFLKKGDIVVDGGNSYFKDSIRRGRRLKKQGIQFLDVGTSGGIEGARHGACMMIGGHKKAFKTLEQLFAGICVPEGYGYMGSSGAGHFVKMVHNGIEYGMMGAIAEGMQAIQKFSKTFNTDLLKAASVYAHGSIIESRLVSWLVSGMKRNGFASISGVTPFGETEEEMMKLEGLSDMKVLETARLMRIATRRRASYAGKLLATMRNEFGGHKVNVKKD